MAREYVVNPTGLLLDSGILFEINRTIMHPLGFSIAVVVDDHVDDGPLTSRLLIVDHRDEPKGVYFDPFDRTRYEQTLEENAERFEERRRLLGYVVQDWDGGRSWGSE